MLKRVIYIFLGAFLLCQMAFYNMFPLTYSDTGTYITSGFAVKVPVDRPLLYGLFVRHTSLFETLWAAIFCQALIVSYSIHTLIKTYVIHINKDLFFFVTILILVFCTGLSQKTCTLMPDVFAATSALSIILLSIKNTLKKLDIFLITIIFIFSNLVHYTHAYISLLTVIAIVILLLSKKIDKEIFNLKRGIVLIGLTLFSLILTPTIHYFCGGGFITSKGKNVFMTAKLIQSGILEDFLKKNCDSDKYKLCPYKDSIKFCDFLWDFRSPLYKTGGWEENDYNQMLNDVFRSPYHLMMFVYKSIESTGMQFFNFQTDVYYENYPLGAGTGPFDITTKYFNHQLNDYAGSKQSLGRLDYRELSSRQNVLIWFCFILIFILYFNKKMVNRNHLLMLTMCILFLFFNAAICGSLSLPNPRYQSRVVWLLPLIIGVIIWNNDFKLKEKIKNFLAD